MPNRDRTGPTGQGPATGWGVGPCGSGKTGYPRFGFRGRGWRGRGFGYGYGWREDYVEGPPSTDQERSWLEDQARNLKDALNRIQERLDNLNK
jgi:hypothetical protein